MESKIVDHDKKIVFGNLPTWKYYTVYVKNNLPEIMNRLVSECSIHFCLPTITHIGYGKETNRDVYLIGVISDEQEKVEKVLYGG
jgi:hypothetical protein